MYVYVYMCIGINRSRPMLSMFFTVDVNGPHPSKWEMNERVMAIYKQANGN